MNKLLVNDFKQIIKLIQSARYKALQSVNKEQIELYWKVGEYVSKKIAAAEWGEGVVDDLAEYLKNKCPDIKGFNRRGLYRMRQFYETYKDSEFVSPLVTQIAWTHNLIILSKTKSIEEKEFYLKLVVRDKLGKRELERQIDSGLFERTISSNKKLSTVLKEIHPKAEMLLKDSYMLDFLSLPEPHNELDLKKAIIQNMKQFIIEAGRDFAFIGEEYRLQVGSKDYYVDLLFYHRALQCLVVFELKIDDFKPEYLGKLGFYLEALDRDIKKEHEKPSIGIILCKTKDDEVVEYAMARNLSPAMIAEYQTKLIDKNLLKNKLHELYELKFENQE